LATGRALISSPDMRTSLAMLCGALGPAATLGAPEGAAAVGVRCAEEGGARIAVAVRRCASRFARGFGRTECLGASTSTDGNSIEVCTGLVESGAAAVCAHAMPACIDSASMPAPTRVTYIPELAHPIRADAHRHAAPARSEIAWIVRLSNVRE